MIRINILQPESLIQNAVRSDSDLLPAQFFHTGAFHHTAQRKIHIRPDIIFLRRHFFRKGAFPSPAGHPAVLKDFVSIQHSCPEILLFVHFLVYIQSVLYIGRFYDKKEFAVSKISFHSVMPSLIPDIQKICKDPDRNQFPAPAAETVPQFISRLLQITRIDLLPLPERLQLFPGILLFPPDFLQVCFCFLKILFQAAPQRRQALFQPKKCIFIYIPGSKPLDIPHGLIRSHILFLPRLQAFRRLLPSGTTVLKALQSLIDAGKLLFQCRISTVRNPQDNLFIFLPQRLLFPLLTGFQRLQTGLLTGTFCDPVLQLPDLLPSLQDLKLSDLIAAFLCFTAAGIILCISLCDLPEMPDLLHRLFNLTPHPAVLHDAFLKIFDMDVLFHADIFFHKIFKFYVHPKWNGTFK